MREETRQKRHETIAAVAYDLLASHGYSGTTMLRIATAARASNETLYRWYGDKDGLFLQMVRDNAAVIQAVLQDALAVDAPPMEVLDRVAPVFLTMLLGERAILLNRAAAADPSGRLGAAISAGGRQEVQPLLAKVLTPLCEQHGCAPSQAADWFLSLLIGDLQIRRVIGELPAPDAAGIERRCRQALEGLSALLAARQGPTQSIGAAP